MPFQLDAAAGYAVIGCFLAGLVGWYLWTGTAYDMRMFRIIQRDNDPFSYWTMIALNALVTFMFFMPLIIELRQRG
jgi:uncharacterized membrane protein YidH (DUF202 family)